MVMKGISPSPPRRYIQQTFRWEIFRAILKLHVWTVLPPTGISQWEIEEESIGAFFDLEKKSVEVPDERDQRIALENPDDGNPCSPAPDQK